MKKRTVYFAHPYRTYGSLWEVEVERKLKVALGDVEVLNPKELDKEIPPELAPFAFFHQKMREYFLPALEKCEIVAVARHPAYRAPGVEMEAAHALKLGKEVWVWREGKGEWERVRE